MAGDAPSFDDETSIPRRTTTRRNLQQIVHTCQEALSAHENHDDVRHVRDDLHMARELISHVLETVDPLADKLGPPR